MKRWYTFLGLVFFCAGLLLSVFDGEATGAVVGAVQGLVPSAGFILFFTGAVLLIAGHEKERLEDVVEKHWKKYPLNRDSIVEDIEEEYLGNAETQGPNKRMSYEEQFYQGHAAQGGRVIDVESHIEMSGKNRGKLIHFNQPANAKYLWVVDEEGNFIVANRQTMLHDMPQMNPARIDYLHRLHKLPHPTIARERKIYGSGEVIVEGGLVKTFNTASGHYIDIKDIEGFNKQGVEVFKYFLDKVGWREVPEGAKYQIKK